MYSRVANPSLKGGSGDIDRIVLVQVPACGWSYLKTTIVHTETAPTKMDERLLLLYSLPDRCEAKQVKLFGENMTGTSEKLN